jgi:hypothetical protein
MNIAKVPMAASIRRVRMPLAIVCAAAGSLMAASGCAWFTTPVGQPLPGETQRPATAAPAAAPQAQAQVQPGAPVVAGAAGDVVVHPPGMRPAELLATLRERARARGAQGSCYLVLGQAQGLTPVQAGPGQAPWGSFGCDPVGINPLILGRAIYLEGWWIWPGQPGAQANLQFFGPPGTAYLGRPEFGGAPQRSMLEEVQQFRSVPASSRLVIFFNAVPGQGPAGQQPGGEGGAGGADPGGPGGPAAGGAPGPKGPAVDEAQTLALLKASRPTMDRCFQSAGKAPGGALSLDVRIDGAGKVNEVKILSSDLRPEILDDCISGVVRALVFPAPRASQPVDLSIPFIFSAR